MSIINNITTVLTTLTEYIKNAQSRKVNIPAEIILVGAKKRSGISTIRIEGDIIDKKNKATAQNIANLPTESLPSGVKNMDNIATRIIVESIVNELLENAIVEVAVDPLSLQKAIAAAIAGGIPLPAKGKGIIR